jgi:hypothetical protein
MKQIIKQENLTSHKKEVAAMYNFIINVREIQAIMVLYNKYSKAKGNWVSSIEVLKRASIILLITAWETIIEDLIILESKRRIESATSPKEVKHAFTQCANKWLLESKPKPPDLLNWAGDNWKKMIIKEMEHELSELNTPNSKNIKALSRHYLGINITDTWKWKGTSSEGVCKKLDKIIELRGNIVHKGKDFIFDKRDKVPKRYVNESIKFVLHLACITAEGLNIPVPEAPITKYSELSNYLRN